MSKFDSCLTSLNLRDSLPVDALRSVANEYQAQGEKPAEALLHAVEDQLQLAQLEEGDIQREVAEKFAAIGGTVPERSAGDAALSAVKNLASGTVNAIDALGELFGGTKLNSGLTFNDETYAKAKPLFQEAAKDYASAGSDIADVMRAVLTAVVNKFGKPVAANMKPYITRFIRDFRDGKLEGDENVDGTGEGVAGSESNGPDGQPGTEKSLFDVGPGIDGRAPGTDGTTDEAGRGSAGRTGVSGRRTATGGAQSDNGLPGTAGQRRPDGSDSTAGDASGSGATGRSESQSGPDADLLPATAAGVRNQVDKREAQRRARTIPVTLGDRDNIDATLPYLLDAQREDVAFAEARFNNPDKQPGVMLTNGTGTGKTFSGGGIIARFVRQGKDSQIIVVPNEGIANDWIRALAQLDVEAKLLTGLDDNGGSGVVVTTYANFGQNVTLADRDWDLVTLDESHRVMANAAGDATLVLPTLQALTRHPSGWSAYTRMKNRDLYDKLAALPKPSAKADGNQAERGAFDKLVKEINEREESQRAEYTAIAAAPIKRPKTLMLSATPFAYDKAVDYAEGYLFSYPADGRIGNSNQSGRAAFFVQHFGYRIRYHKLTQPDGNVDQGLMARQFNQWLKAEGALSGRMLEVEADYERRFVIAESALGTAIDEGFEFMREHPKFKHLYQPVMKEFNYLARRYLLEAIKAKESIPAIREQLAAGRKVVIVHDYKKGGSFNPFKMQGIYGLSSVYENGQYKEINLEQLGREFMAARPDLASLVIPSQSALATLTEAFPDALVHNGSTKDKQLEQNKIDFNSDADDSARIIILQSEKGREGISLHDTTGKFMRVMFNIGMQSTPTALVQLEGRIYRTGQVSNAVFMYANTGTNWERYTFAETIAGRADIVEALAMGEQARGLKGAIIEAFEDSAAHSIGDNDGTGGKSRDRELAKMLTDWDKAKSFYYSQLKRNSSNKALEGKDYFATPEPLGMKMVEWADIRPGEDVLEPSAGHGAIARWFPIQTKKTIVEPSTALINKARLAVDGDDNNKRFEQQDFEQLHISNKFDAIVMNPPFGHGGATAMFHVNKAFKHLRDGGRIVAIIPTGPAADAKLEKMLYGEDAPKDMHLVADISLPTATFGRAGTGVMTHVIIIDKIADPSTAPNQVRRDLVDAENVEGLFERIENMTLPGRAKTVAEDIVIEEAKPATRADKPARAAAAGATGAERFYATFEFEHTKTGEQLFGASMLNRVSSDAYKQALAFAKSHGGSYNKFTGGGAKRGFLFKSAEDRAAFMNDAAELDEVRAGLDDDAGTTLRDITRSIEVDGKRRPITNSRGQLVAQDFAGQMAFWKFYKDGPTDERGQPLVVFHGTRQDFDTFDTTVRGGGQRYFFAADPKVAEEYGGTNGGQNVMPSYVALQNPLRFDNDSKPYSHIALTDLPADVAAAIPEKDTLPGRAGQPAVASLASVIRAAESLGFDGVIATNIRDGGGAYGDSTPTTITVAVDRNQIKSATGNAGTFDPADPSIVRDVGPRQTGTPSFKQWFGDWTDPKAFTSRAKGPVSAAVDGNGQPLRLFHATKRSFTEFKVGVPTINSTTFGDMDTERHGIFTTPDVAFAETYLGQGEGQNVMPLYMSVMSPMDMRGGMSGEQINDIVENADGKITRRDFYDIKPSEMWQVFDGDFGKNFVEAARAAGYDGAIIVEYSPTTDQEHDVYVAFEPQQIKSATGNNGQFNPNDPNITRDISGLPPLMTSTTDAAPLRVATLAKLKAAQRRLEAGEITDGDFRLRVEAIIFQLENRNASQARKAKPRERGAAWVMERLMRARRTGELDGAAVDFALWALDKNPAIAEDLGISLKTPNERGTAGMYNDVARVMTLFKGAENTGTAVHEILHHTERMMPPAIQAQIIKAWHKAYARAFAKADEKTRAVLGDMLIMAVDKQAAERVIKAFGNGTLDYDTHYQLSNPSEFWAVNATRIMSERFEAGSWVAKAKQWLTELLQKARALLGLPSDAAVLKGLQAVLNGTGAKLSPRLLVDQAMSERRSSNTRDIAPTQTDTPAFKRWFGESKVVDKKGAPLVVFHGTERAGFDTFEMDRAGENTGREFAGAYFTNHKLGAMTYSGTRDRAVIGDEEAEPGNYEVYLRMENPYVVDFDGQGWDAEVDDFFGMDELVAFAKDAGYDGVIANNLMDEGRYGDGYGYGDVTYVVFEPEQIKSATDNTGAFDPSNPSILRDIRRPMPASTWTDPEMTGLESVIYTLQNKHVDMKATVEAVNQVVTGLEDKWDPYLQEELFHGRAATGFKEYLNGELRPLLDDMKARGVTVEEFEEFLHMRTAQETNEQIASINPEMPDGGSGIDTQDALNYLAGLPAAKRAEYDALAARVDAMTAQTQTLLVGYGLEKQSTIDAWNATYQHYVPLMREDMEDGQAGNGTGAGFSIRGSASKRRMGSSRKVVNILANLALAREKAVTRGEKNRMATALYGLALQAPNPGFWRPVNPLKDPAALDAELQSMGLSPALAAAVIQEQRERYINPKTGLVSYRLNPELRKRENVISVRVDGEDRFIFFQVDNPRALRMATTIKNMTDDTVGRFLSTMGMATRWFAAVNTQFNPIFGVVNLVRDLGEGAVNLSDTPIAGKQPQFVAETARLLAAAGKHGFRLDKMTGADAALWAEFQKEGGITGYRAMFSNSDDRARDLAKHLNPTMWMESKVGKFFTADGTLRVPYEVAQKAMTPVFDWLSDYNEALENVTRMAAYKIAKAEGLTNQRAASLAKNLTVNFNRKGAIGSQVGSLYAFFNAAAQGIARLAKALSSPAGKKIIVGGMLLGVLQAAMLAAAGFEDLEPPEFIRAKNFIIPIGGKQYLSVPYPLGYNFLPTTGRLATEFVIGGAKKPGKYIGHLTHALLDTFNPIGTGGSLTQTLAPTIGDPIAALDANKDWTGKPIYREDMSRMRQTPGYTRAKDTASGVGKAVAYGLNSISGGNAYSPGKFSPTPDQVDYLIGQVTGGVGRELMKTQQTITATFTGEEIPAYKVPLYGRFVGDAGDKSSVSTRFYDNLKTMNQAEQEWEGRKDAKDGAKEFRARTPDLKLANQAQAVERKVAKLRRRKSELIEKKADKLRVKEIELQIRKEMQEFNERVERKRAAVAQ